MKKLLEQFNEDETIPLIDMQLCGCVSIKELIDKSLLTSMMWEKDDDCTIEFIASLVLSTTFYMSMFYAKSFAVGEIDKARQLFREINDIVRRINNECREHLKERAPVIHEEMMALRGETIVPDGATIN